MAKNRPNKSETPTSKILYIRTIPPNLKAYFKAYCYKRNRTMTGEIINLMREAIKGQGRTR